MNVDRNHTTLILYIVPRRLQFSDYSGCYKYFVPDGINILTFSDKLDYKLIHASHPTHHALRTTLLSPRIYTGYTSSLFNTLAA